MIVKFANWRWYLRLGLIPVFVWLSAFCWQRLTGSGQFLAAAAAGQNRWAEFLVLLGADVNTRTDDDSGNTALHFAAERGNFELIHFLIYHGADINAIAVFHYTPLAEAREAHQTEAERVLVAHGAKSIAPYPYRP